MEITQPSNPGVLSINSLTGDVTLAAGTGITLTPVGNTITIAAPQVGTVTSVSGTADRITSTGGNTPIIDIAATYVGQTSITTLGTISTGVWSADKIGLAYGGTHANLSATGGASQVLKQSSSGADITVGQLALTDMSDTSISSPASDQVLRYNGTVWVNGAPTQVNAGAGVDFFYDDTASDIATYDSLNRTPENVAESTFSAVANNGRTLIKAFASSSAGLGGTQIDAGIWTFDFFAYVDVLATGISSVDVDVYSRTSGGTETLLFNINSGGITGTSIDLYTASTTQQAFTINATDRLVVKVYAKTTAVVNRTVTFTYGGTTHYSNFSTPLAIRHNDLSGLQGGTSGQYYHLTSAQNTVVGNTSGTNTGDQLIFKTISVSGQSDVVADTTADTLTLVAGTNVTITTNAATDAITINASSSSMTWTEVTGTSQTMAVGNGYIASNAGLVTLTLPAIAAVGSEIQIAGKGDGGWRVAQNASGQINFGNQSTTVGTGGRLDSVNQYDAVRLVCVTANNIWVVISSIGNITIT